MAKGFSLLLIGLLTMLSGAQPISQQPKLAVRSWQQDLQRMRDQRRGNFMSRAEQVRERRRQGRRPPTAAEQTQIFDEIARLVQAHPGPPHSPRAPTTQEQAEAHEQEHLRPHRQHLYLVPRSAAPSPAEHATQPTSHGLRKRAFDPPFSYRSHRLSTGRWQDNLARVRKQRMQTYVNPAEEARHAFRRGRRGSHRQPVVSAPPPPPPHEDDRAAGNARAAGLRRQRATRLPSNPPRAAEHAASHDRRVDAHGAGPSPPAPEVARGHALGLGQIVLLGRSPSMEREPGPHTPGREQQHRHRGRLGEQEPPGAPRRAQHHSQPERDPREQEHQEQRHADHSGSSRSTFDDGNADGLAKDLFGHH